MTFAQHEDSAHLGRFFEGSAMPTVIYFHGFESNCQTEKFQRTKAFFATHGIELVGLDVDYVQIPPLAIDKIVELLFDRHEVIACVGCSLGGYWANRSAVLHRVSAAVVNPALEFYQSKGQDIEALAAYKKERTYAEPNHAPRVVMLGTADEVLDYRVAQQAFPPAEIRLVEGGSHAGYDFLDEFLQAALAVMPV